MAINPDAAFSRGDVMREIADLKRRLAAMETARRLEAAAVGRGGLRIQGGRLTIQDIAGDDMFRAGGDPGELFLRQDLLSPFAVAVLADRIESDEVDPQVVISNETSFIDLPGSPGPEVSVEILSGAAIVLISARIECSVVGVTQTLGYMGVEVSGASSVDPDVADSLSFQPGNISDITRVDAVRMSSVRPFSGLAPGLTTFTAKYRTGTSTDSVGFDSRSLVVIAF